MHKNFNQSETMNSQLIKTSVAIYQKFKTTFSLRLSFFSIIWRERTYSRLLISKLKENKLQIIFINCNVVHIVRIYCYWIPFYCSFNRCSEENLLIKKPPSLPATLKQWFSQRLYSHKNIQSLCFVSYCKVK